MSRNYNEDFANIVHDNSFQNYKIYETIKNKKILKNI